jgi:hypothetical protein
MVNIFSVSEGSIFFTLPNFYQVAVCRRQGSISDGFTKAQSCAAVVQLREGQSSRRRPVVILTQLLTVSIAHSPYLTLVSRR